MKISTIEDIDDAQKPKFLKKLKDWNGRRKYKKSIRKRQKKYEKGSGECGNKSKKSGGFILEDSPSKI